MTATQWCGVLVLVFTFLFGVLSALLDERYGREPAWRLLFPLAVVLWVTGGTLLVIAGTK